MSRYRAPLVTVLLVGLVLGPIVSATSTATPATTPGTSSVVDTAERTELWTDNGTLRLNMSAGATIIGTSDLPPGTPVTVRIRSSGDNPFLRSISTTVDQASRFRVVTDLSSIPPDTPFTVTVHYNGTTIAETTGRVTPCADCESTPAATTIKGAENLSLRAGQGIPIRGRASVPPGAELNVRLRSSGDTPFLLQRSVRVNRTGQFRAVVDLANADPGSQFELTISYNDTQLYDTSGTVIACPECDEEAESDGENRLDVPNTFELVHGDTPAVPITLNNATEGTLVIGGDSVNYRINATVRDGNGDGSVWVDLNVSVAGRPDRDPSPLSVRNDQDTVSIISETALPADQERLDGGEYPVRVYYDGELVDRGLLIFPDVDPTTGDSDDETADESASQMPAFGFERNIVSTYQGQKLSLAAEFGTTGTATIRFGDNRTNYTAVLTVEDGNDDGRVELLVDTTAIDGDGGAWRLADGGDRLTVKAITTNGSIANTGTLQTREYPVSIYRGSNTSGQPTDIGTIAIKSSPGTNPTTGGDTDETTLPFDGLGILAIGGAIAVIGLVVIVDATRR
ncbi:MAG: BGTF surface domain-containing protein [Halobacteriales archaeon]